jgi:glucose/arabinose dehydrogenase
MHQIFTPTLRRYALLFLTIICAAQATGQAPTLVFQPAISGLSSPVDIVNASDGSNRIFVVQQGGTIRAYNQSLTFLNNYLTVTGILSGGEQGLLSLAFHPDFTSNGFLYVYYTSSPAGAVTIARYTRSTVDTTIADPASRVVLLSISKPTDGGGVPFSNHNGGKLNFGPDGHLYFATGDGGSGNDPQNNGQDGSTLRGKMIRLDVSNPNPPYYFIPADNPYTSDPLIRDEIWALGLRNPWRWSFDKLTNDMWIADVGQSAREEVNFRAAGTTGGINYGWRCFEGFISTPGVPDCTPANYVPPIFDYTHDFDLGGISVTGGYVYRGSEFPNLYGYYIASDYASGNVWLILPDGSNTRQEDMPTSLTTFGEAEDGTLYAAAGGTMYKVTAVQSPAPVKLISFTLRQSSNFNDINWKTASEYNVSHFSIESSTNGTSFTEAGRVAPSQQPNGSAYSFRHYTGNEKKLYYRLHTVDNDGTSEYSKVITTILKKDADPIKLYPSIGSSMLVELIEPFRSLSIINMYGQVIHRQVPDNATGIIYINTSNWKKGVYVLIADNDETRISRKFIIE